METTMRANVRFAYWAETTDETTVELTVRAEVAPAIDAVTDRLPELCHPGAGREIIDVEVLDENLRPMTLTQVDARFGAGTYADIIREVKSSRLESDDSHISYDPPERDDR
jgi:hypothetical protein